MKDLPDGSWECTVNDPQDIKRAFQMQEGVRRIDVERGEQLSAKRQRDKERVVRKDGKVIEIDGDLIDHAKNRIRPLGRGGRSAAESFSFSGLAQRYVRGPDGLDFVWDGGWQPVTIWATAASSPQRDPAGNVWVKPNGEWLLESEA